MSTGDGWLGPAHEGGEDTKSGEDGADQKGGVQRREKRLLRGHQIGAAQMPPEGDQRHPRRSSAEAGKDSAGHRHAQALPDDPPRRQHAGRLPLFRPRCSAEQGVAVRRKEESLAEPTDDQRHDDLWQWAGRTQSA